MYFQCIFCPFPLSNTPPVWWKGLILYAGESQCLRTTSNQGWCWQCRFLAASELPHHSQSWFTGCERDARWCMASHDRRFTCSQFKCSKTSHRATKLKEEEVKVYCFIETTHSCCRMCEDMLGKIARDHSKNDWLIAGNYIPQCQICTTFTLGFLLSILCIGLQTVTNNLEMKHTAVLLRLTFNFDRRL